MIANHGVLYGLIIACEFSFWLVLGAALVVRYLLRRSTASKRLLLALPVIDLLLFAVAAADLAIGKAGTFAHGLAVAYLGFTLAFGPWIVRRADAWFAFRYAGGPRPRPMASSGWAAVRDDLNLWLRCVLAWGVTLALMGTLMVVVADDVATQPLKIWYRIAMGSIAVWFLLGPLWSLVFLSWRQCIAPSDSRAEDRR